MISFERSMQRQRFWPWWRLMFVGLNILALVISFVLSWHYLDSASMIGCNAGSPCEKVLNSRWSSIGGVLPVSSLAMGLYLAMLVAGCFVGFDKEHQIQKLAWNVLLIMAGSITGSAIWFFIVQKWFVGSFCPYCMTLHITGLLLSALITWQAIIHSNSSSTQSKHTKVQNTPAPDKPAALRFRVTELILIGLLMSGIMATGQMVITPKLVYTSGKSQNNPGKDNLTNIDYDASPLIGSPNAPYIVKLLFDYQCSHCQKIHFMLSEAVRRYSGKLAFVLCPTPLNSQCNPYIVQDVDAFKNSCELARISLAVWVAKHEAIVGFENWMFTFESGDRWQPRSVEAARAKAAELVGQQKFNETIGDAWIVQYMQTCIGIYGQTVQGGKGGIPKLVYGSRWVIPGIDNKEDFITILQESLGVPKL